MKPEFLQLLSDPPKRHRPAPFWSWNEHLSTQETRRQIDLMDAAGLGGYFMHARGGLGTPYMGEEWFANIAAGIDEARARGMDAWAYDENGWPSGFGNGVVNGRGEAYWQKYLRYEWVQAPTARPDGRTIACLPLPDGRVMHLYYEANPYYVDLLDPAVTQAFLTEIYEPYASRYRADLGEAMPGFFTDEPQLSRNGIPWSLVLPERYQATYGEDLRRVLPHLFLSLEGYQRTRHRFWHLLQELFVTGYTEALYEWCEAHGALLTGHMVLEETLLSQLTSNSAVMPHYEFFHMPGMDWLLRRIEPATTPHQVASVAQQLGQRRILSESFAGTGWNVTFEELKWMYEWQMARGITTLCPHLEAYSLRGLRKRDWPPSLYYQQPWWRAYRTLTDAVSRVGMLLAEGEPQVELLVIHPQSSAWLRFDHAENEGLAALQETFLDLTYALEGEHLPFHYGDERILRRHGSVRDGRLTVGRQQYRTVIVPPADTLASSTVEILMAFAESHGQIVWLAPAPGLVDGAPDEGLAALVARGRRAASMEDALAMLGPQYRPVSVTDAEGREIVDLAVTWRALPEAFAGEELRFIFLANKSRAHDHAARIRLAGRAAARLDMEAGALERLAANSEGEDLSVACTVPRMGSLALLVSDDPAAFDDLSTAPDLQGLRPLEAETLVGVWEIELLDPNALVLDHCAYWLDGELQSEREHVSAVQWGALDLERPVEVRMVFTVVVAEGFTPGEEACLVVETPEHYAIAVNGEPLPLVDAGAYRDPSFRKIPLGGRLRPGENHIELTTTFQQSDEVYEHLRRARVFEAEKNNLSFDCEIEALYLIGDFSVQTPGEWTALPQSAMRYVGPCMIGPPPKRVTLGDLTSQGLPFFSGSVRLTRTLALAGREVEGRALQIADKMCNHVALKVNGAPAGTWFWRPYLADLSGRLRPGENSLSLTLTGSLRNLLGPHHLEEGETYAAHPSSFYKVPNVWGSKPWDDGYCLVAFGLTP